MVATVSYTRTHSSGAYMGQQKRTSERARLYPFTRALVSACRFRTSCSRVVGAREPGWSIRAGPGQGSCKLHRMFDRKRRGEDAVSVQCCTSLGASVFDVGKVNVPVVLMFIADHGEGLRRNVVDSMGVDVFDRVIGARHELVDTQTLVDS